MASFFKLKEKEGNLYMSKDFDHLLIKNREIYKDNEMEIPFLLGVDQKNEPVFLDMDNHYLLNGSEGTGKTNILNLFILSSMYLRKTALYYLFDSHHNEFIRYKNFKTVEYTGHCDNLSNALNLILKSLDKRREIFSELKVENIKDYNKKYTSIPYMVIVIDDFLSMNFNKENMLCLQRILSIGRAFGIMVLCSIQRKEYIPAGIRRQFLTIETLKEFKIQIYTSFYTYKILNPFMIKINE